MFTYIRNAIKGYYIVTDEQIDAEYWTGWIGSTYEDFLDGKWILLSNEQVEFHTQNPDASIEEVLNMELTPAPQRTLEDAKQQKIAQIDGYDKSAAVNNFILNGQDMWLTVEERQQLATQIAANEAANRENMTRWFGGISYTLPIATWKQMLNQLEIYAGDALNVTESHKAAVNALSTIEDVDTYEYRYGYPERINFGIL